MSEGNGRPDAAEVHRLQRLRDGAECLAAALDYLALGWAVLCCCPPDHAGVGKKHGRECANWGKVPLHPWKSLQTAAPAAEEVKGWWRAWPTANVGCALGRGSRLVRLDIEGPQAEARLLELSGGDMPLTLEFASGRADGTGRGLLFAPPAGLELRTAQEGLALGGELRIQGEGAQTVLPPSRHRSGRRYTWTPGRGPEDIAPAPAPAWLLAAAKKGSTFRARADGGAYRDPREGVPEGSRHSYLTRLAGLMRGRAGASAEAIRAALFAANEHDLETPLPEDEVEKIAAAAALWEQGPRGEGGADPCRAAAVIRAYWEDRYEPRFRRGPLVYSGKLGREVRDGEFLGGAPSDLIDLLAAARDAPRDPEGKVKRAALPAFFRTWAPTSLQDLRADLAEEEKAGLAGEVVESAAAQLRRLLSAALLTLHALGREVKRGDETVTETERRAVVEWAALFARPGKWGDVRSLCLWSRQDEGGPLRVALRPELFSQIHAHELARFESKRLTELCVRYGLATPIKVKGGDVRAVELTAEFVFELVARGCPEPDSRTDAADEETHARAREETCPLRPSDSQAPELQGVPTDDGL